MGKDKGLETLIEESGYELIKLNNKEFKVGQLGVIRKLKISKLLGNLIIPLIKIFTKTGGGKTNLDDIATLLNELDINKVEDILSIVLNTKDKDILDKINDNEFTNIIIAVIKHNDFVGIEKKVQRVVEAIKEKTTTS